MNVRLQQFLSAENISQAQFADSIGVARASVSHILAGRNKPGWDFITATMRRYPDLNIEWLLDGRGKMYRTASERALPDPMPPARDSLPRSPQPATVSGDDSRVPDNLGEEDEDFLLDFGVTPAEEPSKNTGTARQSPENPDSDPRNTTPATARTASAPGSEPSAPFPNAAATAPAPKREISKVIVFFNDGRFEEMCR